MPELTPRERRFQRTQQAILDAAREIISKQGVEALSIRAIAEKIDYSPAGLYEYYGSKEEIIAALCMQGLQQFARHLRYVDKTLPPEAYLIELGVAYIDFALKNPDFFLLMFTTAPLVLPNFIEHKPDGEHTLQNDDAFSILLHGVERCMDAGLFQPQANYGVLEIAAGTAWALAHGIAMLQLSALRDLPFAVDQIRTALRIQLHGAKLLG